MKTDNRNKTNQGNLSGIVLACLISGYFLGFSTKALYDSSIEYHKHERARTAAMAHYQPVGNGGALAVMNGRISPQRDEMYQTMERAYNEAYVRGK